MSEEPIRDRFIVDFSPEVTAKIDVLVEQGLYTDRAAFLEKAMENELSKHAEAFEELKRTTSVTIGISRFSAKDLEDVISKGKLLNIRALGAVSFADDVTPELVRKAIAKISLTGILRAPEDVIPVLNNRRFSLMGRSYSDFKQLGSGEDRREQSREDET
jgi:Arc/MetJ-type ribon-helix-helix transcriptional regulator